MNEEVLRGVGPSLNECEDALVRAYKLGLEVDGDTFARLCVLAGRVHGPALLFHAWSYRLLDRSALADAASDAWTMAEYPEQALGVNIWHEIFAETGFSIDGRPADRPVAPVRLYRGAPKERRRRMAWTADWSTATFFATTPRRQPGSVWMTDAPPESLLCVILGGREEAEYVIDTRGLKIIPGPDEPPEAESNP